MVSSGRGIMVSRPGLRYSVPAAVHATNRAAASCIGMTVEPTPQPAVPAWVVGWLVAVVMALGVSYWMFSTVKTAVERHSSAPSIAALPAPPNSR
jgi:hypothetical protein